MSESPIFEPGQKTHKDENFPVASYLIRKKFRAPILAFYRFARAADDVADHPTLTPDQKVEQLDQFEATLMGEANTIADAIPLRLALHTCGVTPRHAQELLIAFRQDARQQRYQTWDELMQYCRYSAAPVGRFVLDVHGESQKTWKASDALCSALQIINHLQDCKADYQRLNRIYIPQELFEHYEVSESALAGPWASPGLRHSIVELAERTQTLMAPPSLSSGVQDFWLALEVTIIERVANTLLQILLTRDPLSERVHLRKSQFLAIMAQSMMATFQARMFKSKTPVWSAEEA